MSTLQAGRRPAPARPGAALKGAKRPAAKRLPAGQPARRPKKGAAGATALSALLVTILGACLLFAAYEFQNYRAFRTMRAAVDSDAFYPGVVVDGTDLGGMTLTQALAAFVDRERDRASATGATFAYGDRRWTLTPEDLGYRTDYVDVLKSAYRLGREGSLRQRYAEVLRLANEGTPLSITRGYDPSALRAAVDDIAGQLARDARDASIGSFNFSSRTFQFTSASAGMVVDADELYARAERAISRGSRETIEVAPTRIEPKVTSAQLTAKYGLITSAVTNASSSSKNRLTNIRTALSAIDGTRLDPGEVFSFNGTVGKRTAERGYRPAGAYVDGLVTEEVGGGICQVSTTLFNAAVKADLAIVERSAHSRPVAYVDKGKDATVSWPGPTFGFATIPTSRCTSPPTSPRAAGCTSRPTAGCWTRA
ncbi:MAG: hypothetical protein GX558_10455 [Clostridiales bacterium]|nr:hypothetical protein [Clostridiales bacterium]